MTEANTPDSGMPPADPSADPQALGGVRAPGVDEDPTGPGEEFVPQLSDPQSILNLKNHYDNELYRLARLEGKTVEQLTESEKQHIKEEHNSLLFDLLNTSGVEVTDEDRTSLSGLLESPREDVKEWLGLDEETDQGPEWGLDSIRTTETILKQEKYLAKARKEYAIVVAGHRKRLFSRKYSAAKVTSAKDEYERALSRAGDETRKLFVVYGLEQQFRESVAPRKKGDPPRVDQIKELSLIGALNEVSLLSQLVVESEKGVTESGRMKGFFNWWTKKGFVNTTAKYSLLAASGVATSIATGIALVPELGPVISTGFVATFFQYMENHVGDVEYWDPITYRMQKGHRHRKPDLIAGHSAVRKQLDWRQEHLGVRLGLPSGRDVTEAFAAHNKEIDNLKIKRLIGAAALGFAAGTVPLVAS